MAINVDPDNQDPFYRYKMPRLIAKVEGKGNGIKTVIPNMSEIAKSLSRPPTYPTKFFGCELGAQTQFNAKDERFIVNGAHDPARLQELLSHFIRKFVLCPNCQNPETNLAVQHKKQMILQRCVACGYQGNIDMRHKLTTFILKNPPEQETANTTGSVTTPGKAKGKGKKKGKDGVNGDTSPKSNPDELAPPAVDEDYDDDWCEDLSDTAVQERMKNQGLSTAVMKLTMSEDAEKTLQERADMFYSFVEQKKAVDQIDGKEILAKAEHLEVKDKAPLVLVELLLDDKILLQLKKYRILFLLFTQGNSKAQKSVLGGLEQLIGRVHPEALMPRVPHILKATYDLDLLDEEVLLEWHQKGPSKKYVSKDVSKEIHAKAAPFLNWLQEAEEESEDSEEEDGVEVVYSHTEKAGVQTITTAAKDNDEEDADDLDIDAI